MRSKFKGTSTLTVEDVFSMFLVDKRLCGLSPATIKTYRMQWNAFCNYFDSSVHAEICSSAQFNYAILKISNKNISPNTIRTYTVLLSTFLGWANENGYMNASIKLYKGRETVPETYTEEELKKLLKRPNKNAEFTEWRNWVIVSLLVNDGCRAATICEMRVGDLDLEHSIIVLRHMKCRNIISVPLCPTMTNTLNMYLNMRGGEEMDYLFPTETNTKLTTNGLRHAINRYNKKRGVQRTGVHKFRHTFAKLYITECGGNALKLQKILGHSTLDMTKHYVNIFSDEIAKDFAENSPLEKLKAKEKVFDRKQKKRG